MSCRLSRLFVTAEKVSCARARCRAALPTMAGYETDWIHSHAFRCGAVAAGGSVPGTAGQASVRAGFRGKGCAVTSATGKWLSSEDCGIGPVLAKGSAPEGWRANRGEQHVWAGVARPICGRHGGCAVLMLREVRMACRTA